MFKKLYINRKLHFPIISTILVFTCLLVTISINLIPQLDPVLNGMYPIKYPWQRFTAIFAHGAGIDVRIHLMGNTFGIIIFGILSERVLPGMKFFIFFLFTLIVDIVVLYTFKIEGNGISTIVWAFTPVVAVIQIYIMKCHRKLVTPWYFIVSALLVCCWVVQPIIFGHNFMHDVGIIVGVIFAVIWSKAIKRRLVEINSEEEAELENKSTTLSDKLSLTVLIIPSFIIAVMLFTYNDIIPTTKVVKVLPSSNSSSQAINEQENQIQIEFDRPMDTTNTGSITVTSGKETSVSPQWISSTTAVIKFNRDFEKGEKVTVKCEYYSEDGYRVPVKILYR